MYTKDPIDTIERNDGISRPLVQSRRAIPLQNGNTKTQGTATKRVSLSKLRILPICAEPTVPTECKIDVSELAELLVDATRKFTGNIDDWEFTSLDSLHDLILRCCNRLQDRAGIDHIDVLRDDEGNFRLIPKKQLDSRSKIFCIVLRPIIRLRHRHPVLFNILFSFIKDLPFINLFCTSEDRIDWLWTILFDNHCQLEEKERPKSLDYSVNFISRYKTLFDEFIEQDWKLLLANYTPRKPLYKRIKELLEGADKIDFQLPFRIGNRDPYDSMFEHWETFLVVDDDESDFTRYYIEMLNESSNEFDIISAYQYTTIEKEKIEPFEEGMAYQINQLEDFIIELNELLRQL